MKYCSNKEIDGLIKALVKEGWIFERGKKHGKLYPPNRNRLLIVSTSPSDSHASRNFLRDVRNAQRLS